MSEQPQRAQTINLNQGGTNKMEEKSRVDLNNPKVKSIFDIPMGVAPTGGMYSVTAAQIGQYFSGYFANQGYPGVVFTVEKKRGNDSAAMYLVFPKDGKFMGGGGRKSTSEIKERLMGTKERGARIRLDGKFKELVRPFCSEEHPAYVQSVSKFGYIELDTDTVLGRLFGLDQQYRVILLDTVFEGKRNAIFRVVREIRPTTAGPSSIEELFESRH